jgi:hypothetical protein
MPSRDPAATQPDPTPTSADPPANPAPKQNSGPGHWWDQAWNKAKSGFHTAVNWAEQHKAEIAVAAVGLAVGVGCGLAIGWTGVGAVACGVLAGAVASAVTYTIATPEKERSAGGLLLNVGIGAATGALSLVGKAAAPVVGAAARAAGAKIAQAVARTAVQKAVGAVVSAAGKGGGGSAVRGLADGEGLINPNSVRYSQREISYNFSSGGNVAELARKLSTGELSASDVPPLRLLQKEGQLWSPDNRQLVAFQEAGVSIRYRMAT